MVYNTLSQAISALREKGYTENLDLRSNRIECKALNLGLIADQFEVDEVHRFEGASNPDDSSILFAISADVFHLKGLLIDAYGAYADPLNSEMIQKLKYRPNGNNN